MSEEDEQIKETAKLLTQLKGLAGFIKTNFAMVAIVGGGLTAGGGSIVSVYYNAIVVPEMEYFVRGVITAYEADSLGHKIDAHMKTKGGGFRSGLSDSTGIDKNLIIDSLSAIITGESKLINRILTLENELEYQKRFNFWTLKQSADKFEHNGINFWQPADGNTYFVDIYGYLWDAKYDNYDDCYYYYPSYGNGNRLKCE